jgi:hypothetical protein
MQAQTGCKINVTQASGADIEREIGLIGSREAIEAAQTAIWEKVDQVVCNHFFQCVEMLLIVIRRRRTTEATVEARVDAAVAVMSTRAMEAVTNTHNHSKLTNSKPLPRACPHKRALQLVVTTLMTRTPLMAATRITL